MSKNRARYSDSGPDATFLRLALFNAVRFRCWITDLGHEWSELDLDHIIPEDAFRDDEAGTRDRYELDPDFDVHGLENLAPICRRCNRKKSDLTLTVQTIEIELGRARKRRDSVQEKINQYRRAPKAALLVTRFLALEADAVELHAPAIMRKIVAVDVALAYQWQKEELVRLERGDVLTRDIGDDHDPLDSLTVRIDSTTRADDLRLRQAGSSLAATAAQALEDLWGELDLDIEGLIVTDPDDFAQDNPSYQTLVTDLAIDVDTDEADMVTVSGDIAIEATLEYYRTGIFYSDADATPLVRRVSLSGQGGFRMCASDWQEEFAWQVVHKPQLFIGEDTTEAL